MPNNRTIALFSRKKYPTDLNFSAPKRNALLHIKSETISTFYTERDISLYHFHKLRRSICDNIK